MSKANQDEITFDGLRQFLCRIGFDNAATVNHSMAFHHRESGTIVALSIPQDGRSVRPADLLSVLMRLESERLVDDSVLERFKLGKLPLAS